MKRLIDWLHARYGTVPVVVPMPKPQEIVVDANAAAAFQLGYGNGMQVGLAQGELNGRIALAGELETQYGIDAREDLDANAVRRIRVRQVH